MTYIRVGNLVLRPTKPVDTVRLQVTGCESLDIDWNMFPRVTHVIIDVERCTPVPFEVISRCDVYDMRLVKI